MNPLVHASSVSGPTMLIIRTLASVCTQGFFTLGEKLGHLSDVMGSHDLYESRLSILSIFLLCLFFSVKCTFTNLKEKKVRNPEIILMHITYSLLLQLCFSEIKRKLQSETGKSINSFENKLYPHYITFS